MLESFGLATLNIFYRRERNLQTSHLMVSDHNRWNNRNKGVASALPASKKRRLIKNPSFLEGSMGSGHEMRTIEEHQPSWWSLGILSGFREFSIQ